jgi:hypothetical protein
MTDRSKRIGIGLILIVGLQIAVSWTARFWFGIAGDNVNIVGIPLIFTIAVYFGGGLVMGLLSEEMVWFEPVVVSLLALAINVLVFLLGVPDLTFISITLSSPSPVLPFTINLGAVLIAAIGGVFLGARIQKPADDWLSRSTIILGLISLCFGPFLLLALSNRNIIGFPWYVLVFLFFGLMAIIGFGYLLFKRHHDSSDEFSINPDRHRPVV